MEQELTVQQASAELGIKVGSVRKAYRQGRLVARRLGDAATWSVLLIDPASVEHYRAVHLGGVTRPRCAECNARRAALQAGGTPA